MEALITAENVAVRHRSRDILKDISLRVEARDFVTIVGPNGAGKSLLLKCLLGVRAPTSGRVARRAGLNIGYMPQQFVADEVLPMTARRFLRMRRRVDACLLYTSDAADE